MKRKFVELSEKYNLINKNDHILVGLSGGADSVCLLFLLMEIKEEYNLTISAAHLNHGVRGEEAKRDEEFSRELSNRLNIKFLSSKADMNKYAMEQKLSKEAAGRVLRRTFLKNAMDTLGAQKLALAHNEDDQVETVLMRILRGTGTDGLKGIEERSDYIIRPILHFSREEIEAYLSSRNIEYVDDSTNFENEYHRNKIRNILLPKLRGEYNPNLNSALLKLSQIGGEDSDYLDFVANNKSIELFSRYVSSIEIEIEKLEALHLAIARRLIRKAIEELAGKLEDVSFDNIEDVLHLIKLESGKEVNSIRGLSIRKSYDKLIFEKSLEENEKSFYIVLKLGNNNVNGVYSILMEEVDNNSLRDNNSIFIPVEIIKGALVARSRRNADRIRPIGLLGSKKIKDIFIDKKIDRKLRDIIPIVEDEVEIMWVAGITKSEVMGVSSKSNRYIKLTLIKNNLEDKNA